MKYNQLLELERILNSKKRYKAIFLLLLRSNAFTTSLEIAKTLNVSERTIKTDIKELKESLEKYPFEIKSIRSKGHLLKIYRKEVLTNLLEYYKTSQTSTIKSEFEERVNYILKIVLTRNDIKLEELEEMLFLSRINREMEEVYHRLKMYNLYLDVDGYRNFVIKGDEVNKLLLFLRLNKQFVNHYFEFDVASYNKHFEINSYDYSNLEAIFYNTLLDTDIVFGDLYAKRILFALIVFKNNQDKDITLNHQLKRLFNEEPHIGLREQHFVNTLNQNLKLNSYDLKLSKEKFYFLVILSIMSIDIFHFKDLDPYNYGSLVSVSHEMVDFISEYFNQRFYVDLSSDYTVSKDLTKIMLPISIKTITRVSDDLDVGYYRIDNAIERTTQFNIVKDIKIEFAKKYDYQFSIRDMYLITSVLQGYFERIFIPKTELNIAIIAINGRLSTQHLKSNLLNYYGKYIKRITTLTLYQITYQKEKYDFVDFYFVMEYGKNLSIDLEPIHYVREDIKENEIDDKLEFLFKKKISYQNNLPSIKYEVLNQSSLEIIETLVDKSVFYSYSKATDLKILIIKSNDLEVKFYKNFDLESSHYLIIRITSNLSSLQTKLIFEFIDLILQLDDNIKNKINGNTNYESFVD